MKEEGYDVISIAQDYSSFKDTDVLALAYKENRVIVTNDKDFGYLAYHQGIKHKGIILFRLTSERPEIKIIKLKELFQKDVDFTDAFIIVTDDKIRIRPKNKDN